MYRIIAVGKIKDEYIEAGINEYRKRISGFTNFEIREVKEVNTLDIRKNISMEGENILSQIANDDFVIALCINGQAMDSIELARFLAEKEVYGASKIIFVIGGSNGLSEEVIKRANFKLSFSKFTFPHQLMRLILAEQIYRSLTISHHKEYHK
jgi:23S rRNA (pseudouridine1915-N3)-methyltransferase